MAFNGAPQKEWQPDEEFGVQGPCLDIHIHSGFAGTSRLFSLLRTWKDCVRTSLIYESRLNFNAWRSQ